MAHAIYPGEFPDRALHTFINNPALDTYARQAEALLEQLPSVFIPRIQYKRAGVKNTCWYVALREEPDVWLVNFTIVPGNLNIELRLAKYFTVEKEHQSELGMWHQNNWPTFGLRQIGKDKAVELLSDYIERATPDVLAKLHKSPSRSSAEYFIKQDLVKLFPDNKVRHGHRPIRNINGSFLELDLQITDLQFAIEVQGPTHYQDLYGNFEEVKKRDEYKRQWCLDKQVKLMHIEWEGYTKTLYRMPDEQRREAFGNLVTQFLESDDLFCEVRENRFRELAGSTT
jgi:hypothetical protein